MLLRKLGWEEDFKLCKALVIQIGLGLVCFRDPLYLQFDSRVLTLFLILDNCI